jgi:hypothetical protein
VKLDDPALIGLLSTFVGVLGTLGGVLLGARSSQRAQRQLLKLTVRSEERRLRSATYAEYLAALRKFRIFIMTQATDVTVIESPELTGGFVALVEGANEYMDSLQGIAAQVLLLVGPSSPIYAATVELHQTLWRLARARSSEPSMILPRELVEEARQAEKQFVTLAHADLDRYSMTDRAAR